MKKDLHLNYVESQVKCSCGNEFKIKSTNEQINIETCNLCHPAYTGKRRTTGSAGRIDKFNKKYGK